MKFIAVALLALTAVSADKTVERKLAGKKSSTSTSADPAPVPGPNPVPAPVPVPVPGPVVFVPVPAPAPTGPMVPASTPSPSSCDINMAPKTVYAKNFVLPQQNQPDQIAKYSEFFVSNYIYVGAAGAGVAIDPLAAKTGKAGFVEDSKVLQPSPYTDDFCYFSDLTGVLSQICPPAGCKIGQKNMVSTTFKDICGSDVQTLVLEGAQLTAGTAAKAPGAITISNDYCNRVLGLASGALSSAKAKAQVAIAGTSAEACAILVSQCCCEGTIAITIAKQV